jgi:hypothetical protein
MEREMIAERWEADAGESLVLDEGSALWERLDERIAPPFGRLEVRARLKRYLARLLTRSRPRQMRGYTYLHVR